MTEIDLATERQVVRDLKVELQKAKKATQLAREVAEVEKKSSYLLGVEETQVRLVEELFELCRDYCDVSWGRALDVEGVPTYLVWRQPGSIYYHPDICEVPGAIPSHSAFALETS